MIIKKKSPYDVPTTLDRLENILTAKGLTVFTRVDHAAGAAKVDIDLPATQVLFFGNPKLGTPLIVETRDMGLDLPMKAMAWDDGTGQVWLSYTTPAALGARHGISENQNIIDTMMGAIDGLTSKAVE